MKFKSIQLGLLAWPAKPYEASLAAIARLKGVHMRKDDRSKISLLSRQIKRLDAEYKRDGRLDAWQSGVEEVWLQIEDMLDGNYLPPYSTFVERAGGLYVEPEWDVLDELMQTPPASDRGPMIGDGCHVLGERGPEWALISDPFQFHRLMRRVKAGRSFTWRMIWQCHRREPRVVAGP